MSAITPAYDACNLHETSAPWKRNADETALV